MLQTTLYNTSLYVCTVCIHDAALCARRNLIIARTRLQQIYLLARAQRKCCRSSLIAECNTKNTLDQFGNFSSFGHYVGCSLDPRQNWKRTHPPRQRDRETKPERSRKYFPCVKLGRDYRMGRTEVFILFFFHENHPPI